MKKSFMRLPGVRSNDPKQRSEAVAFKLRAPRVCRDGAPGKRHTETQATEFPANSANFNLKDA